MCYFWDCLRGNDTSSSPICALFLVLSSVRSGVPSWGQGHKGEGSTLTGSQTILEALWLSYLLRLNSYSHKINSVRKSGLCHLDVPLLWEQAPRVPPVTDENHTHLWLGQQQLFLLLQTVIVTPRTWKKLIRISVTVSRRSCWETSDATLQVQQQKASPIQFL